MNSLESMLRFLLLLALALVSGQSFAKGEAIPEAVLSIANRDIATLRMTTAGASPELRVKRIHERIRQIDERELSKPITRSHLRSRATRGLSIRSASDHFHSLRSRPRSGREVSLDEASQQVEQAS